MPFISDPDGDLKTAFVSDAWLLDQFVGNTLFCWGLGTSGQLGDNTIVSKSIPTQTITVGNNWKQVDTDTNFVSAIKTDGTLWCWGQNTLGQIGDNTITSKSSPVQTVAFGNNWKQVCCGSSSSIGAIKTDGTLWCWGNNGGGQLGDNTVTARSSPVQTVAFSNNWKQVSCGQFHASAIKTDGTLWCWGNNNGGQLGDNTVTARSSPVQTVAFGNNWKQVSCRQSFTAAIKTDGTLWMWGANAAGQLGDNTTISRSSPVQTIAFGTTWKQVGLGDSISACVKTDGTLWMWGSAANGSLGDNSTTNKSSPVQTISYGTNWKQASAGSAFAAGIKTDGSLWIWGVNNSGQLASNSSTQVSSPIQTFAGGFSWKQVKCGSSTGTAVTNGDL